MTNGWIKLHRSILEWEWWNDRNTRDLFIYCLLAANHDEQRLSGMVIPRGTFLTSRHLLALGAGISQQSVRTSINKLVQSGNITIQSTYQYTLLTVCNYNRYQSTDTAAQPSTNQVINQQSTSQSTSDQPSTPYFSTIKVAKQTTLITCSDNDTYTDIKTHRQPSEQPTPTDLLTKNQPSPSREINQQINHKQEYIRSKENKEERKEDNTHSLTRARDEALARGGVVGEIEKIADEVRQEIHNNGSIVESALRLYGLAPQQLEEYLGWFVDKLRIDGTQFKSRSDFRMHFNNWLRKQVQEKINQQHGSNGNHIPRKHQPQYSAEFLAGIAADITSGN